MKSDISNRSFVLEIGVEELPWNAQSMIYRNGVENITKILNNKNLDFSDAKVFTSACRIILSIKSLAGEQKKAVTEILGPPKRIAYDEKGNPTKALLGFLKNSNLNLDDIKIKETDKGEYITASIENKSQKTEEILNDIITEFISNLTMPKTMVWNETRLRFSRPIRWINCFYGSKLIDLEYAGVRASDYTFGVSGINGEKIQIVSVDDLFNKLSSKNVFFDIEKRKDFIRSALTKISDVKVVIDEDLLDEVCALVESPSIVVGNFDKSFLELPSEIIITVLKHHQKYFPVLDNNGNILPSFVGVRNGDSSDEDIVRRGYEKVTSARLFDAMFFYKQDKKVDVYALVEKLKAIVYQEKLGSIYDKTARMKNIAEAFMKALSLDEKKAKRVLEIIKLCKTDLVTDMIFEFPELQGVMGRIYAKEQNIDEIIADGIEKHYYPRFSGDELPSTDEASIVSIVDRIDNVVSSFILGNRPTGSADPYGLRRQINGIFEICVSKKWNIDILAFIKIALENFTNTFTSDEKDESMNSLIDFLQKRLENYFIEKSFYIDDVRSVVYNKIDFNAYDLSLKLDAMSSMKKSVDFISLVGLYKRANNILKQAIDKKINLGLDVEQKLFDNYEKSLYEWLLKFGKIKIEILDNKNPYFDLVSFCSTGKIFLDEFFEHVMVMDKDENLRNNRLNLLNILITEFRRIADFSYITIEK